MRTISLFVALLLVGCAPTTVKKRRIIRDHKRQAIVKKGPPPLRVTTQLSNRFTKAAKPGELIARVRISADKDLALPRAAVNLGLVVDTSGSMAGKAIAHARKATLAMVKELQPGDRIAIVVFNSETRVLVPSTVIDDESRAIIEGRIASMKARGTTDMAGGLSRGITEVRRAMRGAGIHRVVLLSDGMPNDERPIMNLARYAQRHRITITALGLGLDYNETLLGTIARTTGGSFRYIKDPARVAKVFRNEVIRMRQVVAQNMSLRILPGPGVAVLRVFGLSMRRYSRYTTVHLGVLRAGEQRDVFVKLSVPARRAGATIELLDGQVSYRAKTGRRSFGYQHKFYMAAKASDDNDAIKAARAKGFELVMARAEAAQATVDAIALARARQLKKAIALLDRALAAARLAADRFKDKKLAIQVQQMVKLRKALPTLVPRIQQVRRKRWRRRIKRYPNGRRLRQRRPSRAPSAPVAPTPTSADSVRKAHSTATGVLRR